MRKGIVLLLSFVLVFSISGCKKDKNVDKDIYIEDNVDTNVTETPMEDTYEEVEGIEVVEEQEKSNLVDSKEVLVSDTKIINKLSEIVEKVHYNYLFDPNLETGEITESAMQLFAISHIYQYEYQELKQDTEKLILYIPRENVENVIKKFFDHDFRKHGKPSVDIVEYKEGNYLMPFVDIGLNTTVKNKKVVKLGDFSYKYIYDEVDQYNNVVDTFEALIEERDGRYILKNYKKYVEPTSEEVEQKETDEKEE